MSFCSQGSLVGGVKNKNKTNKKPQVNKKLEDSHSGENNFFICVLLETYDYMFVNAQHFSVFQAHRCDVINFYQGSQNSVSLVILCGL